MKTYDHRQLEIILDSIARQTAQSSRSLLDHTEGVRATALRTPEGVRGLPIAGENKLVLDGFTLLTCATVMFAVALVGIGVIALLLAHSPTA